MNSDELKKLIIETVNYLRDYYLDWQDYIERFSLPRMDYYFLIINISSFYKVLDIGLNKLEFLEEDNNELQILYILSFLPMKINFNSTIYNNILLIKKSLDYNDKILKENEKYKKTN